MGTRANDIASLIKSGSQLDSSSIGVGSISQNKIADTVTLGLDSSAVNTLIAENPTVDSAAVESIVGIKKIFNVRDLGATNVTTAYTPNANAKGALVLLQGSTSGGGGVNRNTNTVSAGPGGVGGRLLIQIDSAAEYQTVANYAVGIKGNGGGSTSNAGTRGGQGGDTWFGSSNLQKVGSSGSGSGTHSGGFSAGSVTYNNTNSIGKKIFSSEPGSGNAVDYSTNGGQEIETPSTNSVISVLSSAGFLSITIDSGATLETILTSFDNLPEGVGGRGGYGTLNGTKNGGAGDDGAILVFEYK